MSSEHLAIWKVEHLGCFTGQCDRAFQKLCLCWDFQSQNVSGTSIGMADLSLLSDLREVRHSVACSVARYTCLRNFHVQGLRNGSSQPVPQRIRHIVTLPASMAYETTNLSQYTVLTSALSLARMPKPLGSSVQWPHLTILDEPARMARVLWVSCVFTVTPLSQLTEEPLQWALNIEINETAGIIFLLKDAGSWMHFPCKLCIFLQQDPRCPTSLKQMVLKSSDSTSFAYRFARFHLWRRRLSVEPCTFWLWNWHIKESYVCLIKSSDVQNFVPLCL